MLQFKLDENIDPRWRESLEQAGHDVSTVAEESLQGAEDGSVVEACRKKELCLITADRLCTDCRLPARRVCRFDHTEASATHAGRHAESGQPDRDCCIRRISRGSIVDCGTWPGAHPPAQLGGVLIAIDMDGFIHQALPSPRDAEDRSSWRASLRRASFGSRFRGPTCVRRSWAAPFS